MQNRIPTAREHALGVGLVVAVSLIWVATAVLIQNILSTYNKPFFMSLISSVLFSTLLVNSLRKAWSNGPDPSLRETALFSARLAPLFFVMIYTYNLGLAVTSVASSSTISTLTTLFVLAIGAFVGTELFSLSKVIATGMTIVGVAVISSDDGAHKITGDVLTLISAFSYAVYSVMLKNRAMETDIDLFEVQGFMGVATFAIGWPVLLILHATGFEVLEVPTPWMALLLLFNGLCGTVLSEFLFAKSVVLTSPMVSSLALSLTIPMSLVADSFVKGLRFSVAYLAGTALVLGAFVLVNLDMARMRPKGAPDEMQLLQEEEGQQAGSIRL